MVGVNSVNGSNQIITETIEVGAVSNQIQTLLNANLPVANGTPASVCPMSITPASGAVIVAAVVISSSGVSTPATGTGQIYRGSTPIGNQVSIGSDSVSDQETVTIPAIVDLPGPSAVTYSIKCVDNSAVDLLVIQNTYLFVMNLKV